MIAGSSRGNVSLAQPSRIDPGRQDAKSTARVRQAGQERAREALAAVVDALRERRDQVGRPAESVGAAQRVEALAPGLDLVENALLRALEQVAHGAADVRAIGRRDQFLIRPLGRPYAETDAYLR